MVLTTEALQSEITNIVSPKTSIGYKMTELSFQKIGIKSLFLKTC